jgi:hypothetical protein
MKNSSRWMESEGTESTMTADSINLFKVTQVKKSIIGLICKPQNLLIIMLSDVHETSKTFFGAGSYIGIEQHRFCCRMSR